MKAAIQKQKRRRYTCPICGEAFLSLLELRAHRKASKGRHLRPAVREATSEGIVEKIEDIRSQEYHGYRELNRSS